MKPIEKNMMYGAAAIFWCIWNERNRKFYYGFNSIVFVHEIFSTFFRSWAAENTFGHKILQFNLKLNSGISKNTKKLFSFFFTPINSQFEHNSNLYSCQTQLNFKYYLSLWKQKLQSQISWTDALNPTVWSTYIAGSTWLWTFFGYVCSLVIQ